MESSPCPWRTFLKLVNRQGARMRYSGFSGKAECGFCARSGISAQRASGPPPNEVLIPQVRLYRLIRGILPVHSDIYATPRNADSAILHLAPVGGIPPWTWPRPIAGLFLWTIRFNLTPIVAGARLRCHACQ